ncbi:MAG: diguanylate cyclase [Sulfuricurvum sp.]
MLLNNYRLLYVEDEAYIRSLMRELMEDEVVGYFEASNGLEAMAILENENIDILISDIEMPEMGGLELAGKAKSLFPYLTVFLLSAHEYIHYLKEAIALKVDHYECKPIRRINTLMDKVKQSADHYLQKRQSDSNYLKAIEENQHLKNLALNDPLTGLLNRRGFNQCFEQLFALAIRESKPITLALFDIDNFKGINDTHGHSTGDDVLVQAALSIQGQIRGNDITGRWGGEEFVLLIYGVSNEEADKAVERIRRQVMNGPDLRRLNVTLSAGVSSIVCIGLCESYTQCYEKLLREADQALYHAKSTGKDRLTRFTELRVHTQNIEVTL